MLMNKNVKLFSGRPKIFEPGKALSFCYDLAEIVDYFHTRNYMFSFS